MVSALDSGSSGPGSGPGRGHCVVFLGKTLYSHAGVSIEAGYRRYTAACFASHRRLVCLNFH